MGFLRCHFYSKVLQTQTSLTMTIPDVSRMPLYDLLDGKKLRFPVIYVLHGGAEDSTTWMRRTSIEEYGQQYGFMTVSIDGMSSCYSDMVHGYKFFTYLTQELPLFVEALFPASSCMEDRIIAGFSMGGQGSLKAAFRCPDNYAAAMPLCGARDIVQLFQKWEKMENGPDLSAARDALGPISELRGSEHDLVHLAHLASKRKGHKPRLFVACATNDYAAELTEEFHVLLDRLGIEHTYYKAPGVHDYGFVDQALVWALENWLTLRAPYLQEDVKACT